MKKKLHRLALAFAGTLLLAIPTYCMPIPQTDWVGLTQKNGDELFACFGVRIKNIYAVNVPASAVFLAVAEKVGMPVGVELTAGTDETKITINSSYLNVYQAIGKICSADKNHTCEPNAGGGSFNYIPKQHMTPAEGELYDKNGKSLGRTPKKEPLPYPFTADLTGLTISASSPDDAISQLIGLDKVKKQMPGLTIAMHASGRPFTSAAVLHSGKMKIPTDKTSLRGVLNSLSLVTGQNWIATTVKDSGKSKIEIRFFDKASEVCPDVAKVYIELEDVTSDTKAK